jgi:hypothetical protein
MHRMKKKFFPFPISFLKRVNPHHGDDLNLDPASTIKLFTPRACLKYKEKFAGTGARTCVRIC